MSSGIKCPKCGFDQTTVADSRPGKKGSIYRRRVCLSSDCQERFSTWEFASYDVDRINTEQFDHTVHMLKSMINHLLDLRSRQKPDFRSVGLPKSRLHLVQK